MYKSLYNNEFIEAFYCRKPHITEVMCPKSGRRLGEHCAENTVARATQADRLRAQTSYKRRPGTHGAKPSIVAASQLEQDFDVEEPDQIWVTDITYIRTYKGWLYLAVVIDLYACKVVG